MERACKQGDLMRVQELYEAMPPERRRVSMRATRFAAKGGHIELVRYLAANGAFFTSEAMALAAANDRLEVVCFLHEHGTQHGRAMDLAKAMKRDRIVKYLESAERRKQSSL
jgi:hypothetical protein